MKLIVALAAVLSSAMLTVPTVTQTGSSANDAIENVAPEVSLYA